MKKILQILFFPLLIGAMMIAEQGSVYAAKANPQQRGFTAGVRTMMKSLSGKSASLVRTAADSTHSDNRLRLRKIPSSETYEATLELIRDQEKVEMAAYNLLGRRVLDIPSPQITLRKGVENKIEFQTSSLPEGMYIFVAQGQDLRLAEKFVVSR